MEKKFYDMNLRVLLFVEDGLHHARCLEMDLLGTGKSENTALHELRELIEQHVAFAVFKKDDGLIMFPADQEYFDRWEKAHKFGLHNKLFPDKAVKVNGKAVFITFSKDEVATLREKLSFNQEQVLA